MEKSVVSSSSFAKNGDCHPRNVFIKPTRVSKKEKQDTLRTPQKTGWSMTSVGYAVHFWAANAFRIVVSL